MTCFGAYLNKIKFRLLNDGFSFWSLLYFEGINSFEDMSAAQLYITMKDHRLAEPLQKMILNRMRMVCQAALEEGIELDDIPVDQTIKPVNIYIFHKPLILSAERRSLKNCPVYGNLTSIIILKQQKAPVRKLLTERLFFPKSWPIFQINFLIFWNFRMKVQHENDFLIVPLITKP